MLHSMKEGCHGFIFFECDAWQSKCGCKSKWWALVLCLQAPMRSHGPSPWIEKVRIRRRGLIDCAIPPSSVPKNHGVQNPSGMLDYSGTGFKASWMQHRI